LVCSDFPQRACCLCLRQAGDQKALLVFPFFLWQLRCGWSLVVEEWEFHGQLEQKEGPFHSNLDLLHYCDLRRSSWNDSVLAEFEHSTFSTHCLTVSSSHFERIPRGPSWAMLTAFALETCAVGLEIPAQAPRKKNQPAVAQASEPPTDAPATPVRRLTTQRSGGWCCYPETRFLESTATPRALASQFRRLVHGPDSASAAEGRSIL
jgi:hypothetical protein